MARGKLRIYLGAAPGVGKTYAMLDEGWRRRGRGTDVVIGFVETHGRPKTLAQVRDIPVVPRRKLTYRGQVLEEMDLDAVRARRPAVVLVDELAHTNVPGSRNEKRWQDIHELLDAGIDVISTVNIQHLASLNDVVEQITGITQRETVPDSVVRAADQIDLVDMSPEALQRRMAHGNVYAPEKVDAALSNYFRAGNLGALRELALLWMADRVEAELTTYRERHGIQRHWETRERVIVALTGSAGGEYLLRRASRIAARVNGELVGVHVVASDGYLRPQAVDLDAQRELLAELDGRYAEVTGADIARALVNFARSEQATQIVLGASKRSRWKELAQGSVINQVIREAGPIDVHVISPVTPAAAGLPQLPRRHRPAEVAPRRRYLALVLGTVGIAAFGAALSPLRSSFGLPGALLFLLLGVFGVAVIGGVVPAFVATIVATLAADFFFTTPVHSFRIDRFADVVAVAVFFAVAAAMSALVDRLARRGIQVARAQAEAEALARLAGGSVLAAAETLPNLVDQLRRTFDLDAVAVLAPEGGGWRQVAAAGGPPPERPEDAQFSAELSEGAVLVLGGNALSADDTRLLGAFVAQLRMAQDRIRLELEVATAAELAEANSVRTALLAAVSHDLRTPLASIKAAATSLLSPEVQWSPEEVNNFCKTIDSETDQLTDLVANLLDMSRLNTGAVPILMRPTSVEEVLYSAVESLSTGGSGIVIDVADSLPLARADPGLLERAFANVMSNAQAWSPIGIAVRVEASGIGDHVDIRVIDQGPGIPRDQREKVFEPFQRLGDTTRDGPTGVGLGLAVAKGFTEAMGGELTVHDTPGGGATFVFALRKAET